MPLQTVATARLATPEEVCYLTGGFCEFRCA